MPFYNISVRLLDYLNLIIDILVVLKLKYQNVVSSIYGYHYN